MLDNLNKTNTIYLFVAVKAVFLLLVAFFLLPAWFGLILFLLTVLYILLLPLKKGWFLLILLIPWYTALPLTNTFNTLQDWRIYIIELLIIMIWRQRQEITESFKKGWFGLKNYFQISPVDYSFWLFLATALISLLKADFLFLGLRQIFWFFNIYLFFIVGRKIISSEKEKQLTVKAMIIAGTTVVVLGFFQLLLFLKEGYFYFWQHWSNTVIKSFYGQELAKLTTEFNSWFAYFAEAAPSLRMFSLLPGSHYFAVLVVIFTSFLLYSYYQKKSKLKLFILGLFLFAIVLSGVRGIWISSLAPILSLLGLWFFKKIPKDIFKKTIVVFVLFVVLFFLTPIWQGAISLATNQGQGNFFERAGSITDLTESSNQQRLKIWQTSGNSVVENPILGVGLANYPSVFKNNNSTIEDDPVIGIPQKYLSAHNLYLNILVETGVIGLAAFLFFLLLIFKLAWRKYKAGSIFSILVIVFFTWVFAYSMFDVILLHNDKLLISFWITLSLVNNE